eukprot:5132567-Lingulodinium_polyedra.AAC.1
MPIVLARFVLEFPRRRALQAGGEAWRPEGRRRLGDLREEGLLSARAPCGMRAPKAVVASVGSTSS